MQHQVAWASKPLRKTATPLLPPLLQVLGGKHMVPESAVRVLGQPPFHATGLTSSGALSYVGGNWERDIAFAGYAIPLAVSAAVLCNLTAAHARRLLRRWLAMLC